MQKRLAKSSQSSAVYHNGMIIGVGIDVVEIQRIARAIDNFGLRFVQRVFTEAEAKYCFSKTNSAQHFAARFAAKEAGAKALGGARGARFVDFEVTLSDGGQPIFCFHNNAQTKASNKGVSKAHVSLTHERTIASAVVVCEGFLGVVP